MAKTIVFVHGAWVTPRCWDQLRRPFEAAGYTVHAPTWPHLEGLSMGDTQCALPDEFGGLTVGRIADKYEGFVAKLAEPPVLIGHSFGGLIVQMLLDRGVGAAGVAIDPAPIGGVVPGPSAFAAIAPILLRFAGWRRTYALTRRRFGKLFANGAPDDLVDSAYNDFVIPAPGMIFHQAAFWLGTWVKPERRTQPLLITAGSRDRLVSPYLSRAAYRKQRKSPAPTELKLFEDRSHFLIGEPGWEEVALYALSWVERNAWLTATPVETLDKAADLTPKPAVPALTG